MRHSAITNMSPTSHEHARSWAIAWQNGSPQVIASNWQPGYTAQYHPTPEAAIAAEQLILQLEKDMLEAQLRDLAILKLHYTQTPIDCL